MKAKPGYIALPCQLFTLQTLETTNALSHRAAAQGAELFVSGPDPNPHQSLVVPQQQAFAQTLTHTHT